MILTIIEKMVNKNVIIGVGVGKTKNDSSWTKPAVITADLVIFSHFNFFKIKNIVLSIAIYNAQIFAAQYACTKPLLNGNNLEIT